MIAPYLFWALLAAHVGYSLVVNRRSTGENPAGKARVIHLGLQGPLLWTAAFIGWDMGVFSRDEEAAGIGGLGAAGSDDRSERRDIGVFRKDRSE